MAQWTTPRTWSSVVVTVPDLDEQIRDNMNALHWAVVDATANYTAASADGQNVYVKMDAQAGARTVALYTAVGNRGAVIAVEKTNANTNAVTVDPSGGETIGGRATWLLLGTNDYVSAISDGTNWHVLSEYSASHYVSNGINYTVLVTDDVIDNIVNATTITLHAASAYRRHAPLVISNTSVSPCIIACAGADTIGNGFTSLLLKQYNSIVLMANAAGTGWIVAAERRTPQVTTITTTYTALVTDDVIEATSGTFTVTLHAANAPRWNRQLIISNPGTGVVTVSRAGSDTIVGATSFPLRQYHSAILLPNAAGNAWIIT
jgi:hypothetical protein